MITDKQKKERLNYIGASDAPIICGYSPYRSAYELYLMKRGELVPDDPGEPAHIGNLIEEAIANIFTWKTGVKTRKSNTTIYHADHKFIACNVDRTITWKGQTRIPLEIKNTSQPKEWGSEENGPDGVPVSVYIQVSQQMACTGRDMALVAVLLFGNTLKKYEVPRDDELIEMIIRKEVEFWDGVQSGVPPEIAYTHSTTTDLLRRIYPGTNGKTIDLPENFMEWHKVREDAGRLKKQYNTVYEAATNHIKAEMGEAAVGLLPVDGAGGYTRKKEKSGNVVLRYSKRPGG